ncbi:MAG: homoaconitate hydratase [Actinobacteria bacterium]|nr:homoaconitate hydratase [Actinomycetota bacterium]
MTIERSMIWTGELNERAIAPTAAQPAWVGIYDTTLRDGEQSVGVVLDPEAKLEIARALDRLGVDRIEAGFPRVSAADARAIELIAGDGLAAEVWGFARAVPADVEALLELGCRAAVIESPISDRKLDAYGISRAKLLERVTGAVASAVENGVKICFFGVDGTRGEFDFMAEVYRAAVAAGASEIAVVDTLGIATPEAAAMFVGAAREWVGPEVPIHWHGHNDFGMGTAISVAAVRAGADWVQGTINGMGERAGNANIAEVALALETFYGVETNLRFDRVREVAATVKRLAGHELEPWKALVGENLFVRESGAVASQFHEPESIEPYSAALVGAERGIVLGKKSGLDSIRIRAAELGAEVAEEDRAAILAALKERAERDGGLVSDEVFLTLVAENGGGAA